MNLKSSISFSESLNCLSSPEIKKRKRIKEREELWGILIFVLIQSLSCPVYAMYMCLILKKYLTDWTSHSDRFFWHRMLSSLLCGTLSKASERLRLNIETILPDFTHYAVWMHKVSRLSADTVDLSLLVFIWVQRSRECSSAAQLKQVASTFSTIFISIFLRAIGL